MNKKIIGLLVAIATISGLVQPALATEISPFTYIDIVETPAPTGQVLGTSTSTTTTTTYTCNLSTLSIANTGFYGRYYNMSENDPGMERNTRAYDKELKVGGANYWYSEQYRAFDRVDKDLNFGGDFYPVNTGKVGDPLNFGTHWRAVVKVEESKNYKFSITSDDDSWLLIDNQVVINNGTGATRPRGRSGSTYLEEGYHLFDIYFAQRGLSGSYFSFKNAYSELTYYPLSPGCTVTDFVNHAVKNNSGGSGSGNGRVLGSSTSAYTPAIALYKTANSPAVYAIYANGFRHYITSPTSFYNYGYSFADVQTVSEAKLNSYPDVRLVRTPDDEAIYFIYTRADKQWLKIPIPSPTAFVSYTQNHWGNVVIIDELDRNAYPDAELITANSGDTIYLLKNGEKRRFASIDVLLRLNYNPAEVVSVSQAHLDAYKTGALIQ